MIVYLVIFLLALLIYQFIYKPTQYWKEKKVLHLKAWPIIGNMWGYIGKGMSFNEWLKSVYDKHDARYFGIHQFMEPALLIKDLDLIKQIGIKDFDHFVDHKNFFSESKEPVFSLNLFSKKGQEWKDMRATLSPAFTGSKMRLMYQLMLDCSERFTKYFEENVSADGKPQILQMKDTYLRYNSDVIGTCAFGIEVNSLKDRNNEFFVNGKDVSSFGGYRGLKFLGYMLCPDFMNYLKIRLYSKELIGFFRDLLKTTMEIRERENIYRPDMIHLLMEARKGKLVHEDNKNEDKNTEDASFATVDESDIGKMDSKGLKLTDDDMAAQVLLFFIAGFETSSTTLSFMSYEIAIQEEVQRKLQKEIDEVMDACSGKISYEKILKMKYLDMVICETLRKWPPLAFLNRVCVKPYTIPAKYPNEVPVHLKKNDLIWFPNYCTQKDPKYYPNPEKFEPERFSDENKKKIDLTTYLPFGIGPRNCIGSRFAILQMKVLFVHLLWKFNIVVVKETQIPVRLCKKDLVLASEDGIMLGYQKRIK